MAREKKELTKKQKIISGIVTGVVILIVAAVVLVIVLGGATFAFVGGYAKQLKSIHAAVKSSDSALKSDSSYYVADTTTSGLTETTYRISSGGGYAVTFNYNHKAYTDSTKASTKSSENITVSAYIKESGIINKTDLTCSQIRVPTASTSNGVYYCSIDNGYSNKDVYDENDVVIQYMREGKITDIPNYDTVKDTCAYSESELIVALNLMFAKWDSLLYETTGVHLAVEE